ncbi:MAG: NAD(P)-binding protein, partial [Tabrizicola sp.]|nr:NAD(P)-binding protein [Tabrizicola sp.]
ARAAADAGRRVLVIDKRPHIAGNCYSESVDGIEVHRYGPHNAAGPPAHSNTVAGRLFDFRPQGAGSTPKIVAEPRNHKRDRPNVGKLVVQLGKACCKIGKPGW